MQLQIISVAQKLPQWVELGCDDYLRRLPREVTPRFVNLPLARRGRQAAETWKQREAEQILPRLASDALNLALDEGGALWSSQDWSRQLEGWMREQPRVNLVIGGPDGLADAVLERCRQTVSLGRLTLPHGLVRVVLIEQVYRAWTILQGHPYHRE